MTESKAADFPEATTRRRFLALAGLGTVGSTVIRRRVPAETGGIQTIAGGGRDSSGYCFATEGRLGRPWDVAVGPTGSIFFTDVGTHCVYELSPSGYLRVIAGLPGRSGFTPDGVRATTATLEGPSAIAVDAAECVYIVDGPRVRRIGHDGVLTTIAGNGVRAFAGDGGPAIGASLDIPSALAFDNDGNLLVADKGCHRIRRVDHDGAIQTIAGFGIWSPEAEDGDALKVKLGEVTAMASALDGNLYLVDCTSFTLRRLASSRLTTIAGGRPGRGNDTLLGALDIGLPYGFAISGSRMFVSDFMHSRVVEIGRRVVQTIAGSGTFGFGGDGGPAMQATMAGPMGIAIGPNGAVIVADAGNARLRMIST